MNKFDSKSIFIFEFSTIMDMAGGQKHWKNPFLLIQCWYGHNSNVLRCLHSFFFCYNIQNITTITTTTTNKWYQHKSYCWPTASTCEDNYNSSSATTTTTTTTGRFTGCLSFNNPKQIIVYIFLNSKHRVHKFFIHSLLRVKSYSKVCLPFVGKFYL